MGLSPSLLPYPDNHFVLLHGKSGMMRTSVQSYNQTLISFPAWELGVIPVGTGTGDLQIHFSLSNQGGPIKHSQVTWHKKHCYILCPSKNPLSVQLDLYFLFYLGTSGCPSKDRDRGLTDPCFSLQLRSPTKKSQGNMTQEIVLNPMSNSYNLHLWS